MTTHSETSGLKGQFIITLTDKHGAVKETREANIIVDDGFDFICDALANSTARPNEMEYIAIGQGDGAGGAAAPAVTDSALQSELDRNLGTYTHTAGTKFYELDATFSPGEGTGQVTEAGMLNAAVAGIMMNRTTFAVVNKQVDDTLRVIFRLTLS